MRDYLLTLVIVGLMPLVVAMPHLGVYVWHWFSLMNPHRLTYGFAYSLPFGQIIAVVTILAWLFSTQSKRIPWTAATAVLVMLLAWVSLTTATAFAPAVAFEKWQQAAKIIVMTLVTLSLITTRARLVALIWVAAMSLGFYGFKGGLFTVATGGTYRVWGPDSTFIADNNAIGLALVMVLPLLRFLQLCAAKRWVGLLLAGGMVLDAAAVVGTYSRGALLGLAVVATLLGLRSRHRLATAIVAGLSLIAAVSLLPDKWFQRMETIQQYEGEASAESRLDMWAMALRIAADRPVVGGGFDVFKLPSIYPTYFPEAIKVRDVHSIYFQALGEHGIVGLVLFLSVGLFGLREGMIAKRRAAGREELRWAVDLANCLQASILGFAVSGAFLTLAFFDFFYLIIAMSICLRTLVCFPYAESGKTPGFVSTRQASQESSAI